MYAEVYNEADVVLVLHDETVADEDVDESHAHLKEADSGAVTARLLSRHHSVVPTVQNNVQSRGQLVIKSVNQHDRHAHPNQHHHPRQVFLLQGLRLLFLAAQGQEDYHQSLHEDALE